MNVNWKIANLSQQVNDLQQSIANVENLTPLDTSLQPQIELWKKTLEAGRKTLARLKAQHPHVHIETDYSSGEELMCIHLLPPQHIPNKSKTHLDPELAALQAKLDLL